MPTQEQQEVFKKYIPLVRRIVSSFQKKLPRNVLREDLLSAGLIGLWDAVQRHTGNDDRFEWYARVRIRGSILDELRAQDWLPRRTQHSNWMLADERSLGIVHFSEMANPEKIKALSVEGLEHCSDKELEIRTLKKAIRRLPKREQTILALYIQGFKFKEIAQQMGVSEPRISQIHSRAVARLQGYLVQA